MARDLAPPNAPWRELSRPAQPVAYLSIYLSDDIGRLPVRAVTLPGNNKSDPNLETLTFGLFSTCEPRLRAGAVSRGASSLFFATNHRRRGRSLTGYYQLKWWAEGTLGAAQRDFALAAERARFTTPIPFDQVPGAAGDQIRRRFRQMLLLEPQHAATLRALIDSLPDRTDDYLAEIKRLETYNRFHTGSSYVGWSDGGGFDWQTAAQYLQPAHTATTAPNASPTGWWTCVACEAVRANKALLKRCPACGAPGSLVPAPDPKED
jgi:rubrerythrin